MSRVAIMLSFVGMNGGVPSARAWQQERYRSGMTLQEVRATSGLSDLQQFKIGNRTNSFVAQSRSNPGFHFTFCNDRLSEIQFGLDGGFSAFARLLQVEQDAVGKPQLRIIHASGQSLVYATWISGQSVVALIFQEDHNRSQSIARQYVDGTFAKPCE
jgi:hypothetical protein